MEAVNTAQRKAKHPYITRKNGTCGGKPIIAGTRIKVSQIAIEHERMGMSADEILEAHPHLTLAQIYDALSYYFDHIEEIDQEILEGRRMVEEFKKDHVSIWERKGVTPYLHG